MESSKNRVPYDLLNREKQEFRLLNLKPSQDFDSIIECSLFTSTLKKPPLYEALSYVWGDATNTNSILVNGEAFEITTNLETALRYLRTPLEIRVLWIDAICINQLDNGERSHQVTCMKDIYENCWKGLLWLGPGSKSMDRGMEIARGLNFSHIKPDRQSERIEDIVNVEETAQGENSDDDTITHSQLIGSTAIGRRTFFALACVFVRPNLWKRVWIMQEIAYAPQPVLISGHSTLPWTALEDFLVTVDVFPDAFHETFGHRCYHETFKTAFSTIQAIQHQRLIVKNMDKGRDSHILDVLARFQTASSTDSRDKMFALLALSSNTLGMKADYSASTRSVFTKFATAYINHTENLDILCQSRWGFHNHEEDVTNGIPSWVPDFEQRKPVRLIFAQRGIFGAGGSKCRLPCNVTDKGELIVDGVTLGEIRKLSKETRKSQIAEWMPDEIKALETSLYAPFISMNAENAFQAFWRTLLSDCFRYPMRRLNEEEISSYGSVFTSWKRGDTTTIELPNFDMAAELSDRRFAITENGLYCLTTLDALDGDLIVVLNGAKVPVVLRKRTGNPGGSRDKCEYVLVGPAYVHGLMDGEAMMLADEGRLEKQEFILA
ncbi:hypothetical protein SBOR_7691 [Sclerotinia borealis F-4128]|uniref:Heterokaryon incompatibility domain-containing protein n=1 Tax=Sclerotinia borealis (strain F-4128) TaxID=1432307 RepID=W9C7W4_SCLBF|nr:hypothetical protein SBOR_7691 [Sclerotinia borealis F-4128]